MSKYLRIKLSKPKRQARKRLGRGYMKQVVVEAILGRYAPNY